MRINQEERQYLSVAWFRRVFELERSHSVLKDVRESKEPSLSCHHSTYFLHFGPILLNAIQFFDTVVIILSNISDKDSAGVTGSLRKKSKMLLHIRKGVKYLAMGFAFELFFVSAMAESQKIVGNILRVVVI